MEGRRRERAVQLTGGEAQAVSSRPDLLPPLLTRELEKLQDQIPPFSDQLAMHVLRRDLAADPALIFSQLSASPVAAASLGQARPPAFPSLLHSPLPFPLFFFRRPPQPFLSLLR